jgi:hypothetical protein
VSGKGLGFRVLGLSTVAKYGTGTEPYGTVYGFGTMPYLTVPYCTGTVPYRGKENTREIIFKARRNSKMSK